MNERILELAIKAREYAESKPHIYQVAYDKKFAELLIHDTVRQCAEFAEYQLQIGGTNADKIKQHFGVEE